MARVHVKLTPGGEMAQMPLVLGSLGWGGIISELFQSCGPRLDAPAGTQECPLLANIVISVSRWQGSFPLFLQPNFSSP